MWRPVAGSCVRWFAAVAVLLALSAGQRLAAQDEKVNIGGTLPSAFAFSGDGKQLHVAVQLFDNLANTSSNTVATCPLSPKGDVKFSAGELKVSGDSKITSLAVAPDGRTWATLCAGKVDLWDGITTKLMAKVDLPATDEVTQLQFLDRRTLLIAGSTPGMVNKIGLVRLWDTKANEKLADFNPATRVQQLRLSPDNKTLALIDGEDTVRLWTIDKKEDKYDLKEKSAFKGHKGVTCMALSPDGKRMVTGGADKRVRLWDVEKSKETTFLAGHADTVAWVAFTADGTMPVSWSLDGTARLWDVEADKEARVWQREYLLSYFQISPDGTKLATGGANGVLVWDLAKMAKEEKTPDKPK